MIQRGALSSLWNDVSLIQWHGQKKKLVFSQQESNQWLVQLLYHRTAGDTLELRPEKKKLQRVSTLPCYVIINSNIQSTLQSVPRSSSLFIATWLWFTLDSTTGRSCFTKMANWLVFYQLAFLTLVYIVWIIMLGCYAPSLRTLSRISEEP